jgi:Flp pilus assembly pilin Flp
VQNMTTNLKTMFTAIGTALTNAAA